MSEDFFEPPPPPEPEPEPEPRSLPPWVGAPRGMLPGVVAHTLVIAHNDRVAVCVTRLGAYPTGFEFELHAMAAPDQDELDIDPLLFGPHRHHRRRPGSEQELPDDMLRFGVQFSDGRKATNTAGWHHDDEPPAGPVMHEGGGSGGGGDWRQDYWVWPLPPPGPLLFVCEWPALAIPVTRAEIDAQLVLDAASRAQVLFPGAGEPRPAGPAGLHTRRSSGAGTSRPTHTECGGWDSNPHVLTDNAF
jgi:hypothetical protein